MEETDYEREEQGLTIGEYFRIIFKRVWWVLGATLAGLVIVALLVGLWYNKSHTTYSISYRVVYYAGSSQYPDGTTIIIEDSISEDVITRIKNGDFSDEGSEDEFADVDIDTMLEEGDISITLPSEDDEDSTDLYIYYTINVGGRYFTDSKQAKSFLQKVASYTTTRAAEISSEIAYDKYLTAYTAAAKSDNATFSTLISYLESEKEYLQSKYNALANYGNDELATNALLLSNILTDTEVSYMNTRISNKYLQRNYEQYIAMAEYNVRNYSVAIKDINAKIAAQKEVRAEAAAQSSSQMNTGVTLSEYDSAISSLTSSKESDIAAIESICRTLTAMTGATVTYKYDSTAEAEKMYTLSATQNGTAVEISDLTTTEDYIKEINTLITEMDGYYDDLVEAAATAKTLISKMYETQGKAVYKSSGITTDGGINIFLAAIIGAVLGFAVAALVICIKDAPAYRRRKYGLPEPMPVTAAPATETTPATPAAPATETIPAAPADTGEEE